MPCSGQLSWISLTGSHYLYNGIRILVLGRVSRVDIFTTSPEMESSRQSLLCLLIYCMHCHGETFEDVCIYDIQLSVCWAERELGQQRQKDVVQAELGGSCQGCIQNRKIGPTNKGWMNSTFVPYLVVLVATGEDLPDTNNVLEYGSFKLFSNAKVGMNVHSHNVLWNRKFCWMAI